ncbi:MAG: hypothetical protein NZ805_04220 [Armatimonadetes bacterium]|nr:hypothetical protein [Armatimonadota bacterium]MDW8027278.1 hypothetical protein [Armatimonadota bacterium]
MSKGKAMKVFLGLILVAAIVAVGVVTFMNSPNQVGQKWAEALARKDAEAMKKLVLAKDQERISGLLRVANMFPEIGAQLTGIEDQQGQKVARLSINFTRVKVLGAEISLKGNVNLPFVLVRDRLILWRVDLEKSEPLIRDELRKATVEAIKQNPALQTLLQFFKP